MGSYHTHAATFMSAFDGSFPKTENLLTKSSYKSITFYGNPDGSPIKLDELNNAMQYACRSKDYRW